MTTNGEPTYRVAVDACDVEDRPNLNEYRAKRVEWLEWLSYDEEHAIWRQIRSMLWNDAVFRTINETRRIMKDTGGSAALNWTIARFIDKSYVAAQVLAIRKLTDPEARKPERQVISLRRLIKDIKRNAAIIIRETYICFDGIPYDYEAVEQRQLQELAATAESISGARWLPATGPEAAITSRRMHKAFDKLSGVNADNRSRDDAICPRVFDILDGELRESGYADIIEYGNKFIAHAADDYSRSTLSETQTGFTLERLEQCHRKLCRVAKLIYGQVLWEGSSRLIPTPQFDHFDHLDQPWAPSERMKELRDFWNRHVQSVENWETGEMDFRPE